MQYKKQILPVIGLVVLLLCFMTLFKRSGRTSGSVEEVAEASQEGAVMEDDIGGSDIKPGCEIKFLLDSELTLSEDNELKKSALKAFEIEEDPTSYEVIYLDTQGRDYLKEGWINRIRLKEGKSKYTLTYKKRYDVENDNIEEALETAAGDGFTLTDNRYSAAMLFASFSSGRLIS